MYIHTCIYIHTSSIFDISKMAQIYLDDKTKDILRKIKKEKPNFNLSQYIQIQLHNHIGESAEDIDLIYARIADIKIKIDYLNNEIIMNENKILKIKETEKYKEKEKIDYQRRLNFESEYLEFHRNLSDEIKAELRKKKISSLAYFKQIKGIKDNDI